MSVSDAIVVGEAWISEHYFTTEAKGQSFQAKVVERRKAWDAEAAEGRATARSRFTQERAWLEVQLAEIGAYLEKDTADDRATATELAAEVHDRLLGVLGLVGGYGLVIERVGCVDRVAAVGLGGNAPLAVIHAVPVTTIDDILAKDGATLPEAAVRDDGTELTSAARLVSALFVADDAPQYVLVLAGRWAVLAERDRWAEGRYFAVDIQLVTERNQATRAGEIDRALTCLEATSVAPDADGGLWWDRVLEESVKHTVGVSQDLRDGVRLSIEIIANEVVERRAAKGLDPLPGDQAQVLAKQSLRFLYRILFLLYAEASPELGVLPIGAPEYAQGYSLDRLRELVQVELTSPKARTGTHLYESLGVLFRLVDRGHKPTPSATTDEDGASAFTDGLTFNSLRADLFTPAATQHIDDVGLGNVAVQEVLRHLLLSKEKRGADRGFISYAELGINQLGAVYEGLMSYTGFFAETDLYEVAKGGDSSKGSWVVPHDRIDGISAADFVLATDEHTGEKKPVLHTRGSFVFRLAGRERQQSASYYTPEVLTRFTVGQALEELLDQDGTTTPAAEILTMTVCEPALGSGAFAIEAVRQLAEQYLKRRQKELDERIDPDEYPKILQQVKASIALHNVYGVDLNATAVELAEISLWLDTMVEGLDAPWFGLHLRRGNSLIGARRAVFSRDQITSKSYLTDVPCDVPLTTLADDVERDALATDVGGSVHHFLLPSSGWGSAVDAKEAADLAPEAMARLKAWRRSVTVKPSKTQTDALVDLSYRVEALWQIALKRLEIAERGVRRAIPVWGSDDDFSDGSLPRERVEAAVADAKGAYQRLRRVMDAWCALWFWPLNDAFATHSAETGPKRILPPSLDQWIDALQMLLGRHSGKARTASGGNQTLSAGTSWDQLGDYEQLDQLFAGVSTIEAAKKRHAWIDVCETVAKSQGFFHWELDFAGVMARGGFDLQVGNPPWVRPKFDAASALGEYDPRHQLSASSAALKRATLENPRASQFYVSACTDVRAALEFLSAVQNYPWLRGAGVNLYRSFIEGSGRRSARNGSFALIHLETHFMESDAGDFRTQCYRRLRRHYHFVNELLLFSEIEDHKTFGVNVYGPRRDFVDFVSVSCAYHPDVILRSFDHDGSGDVPGFKDPSGRWDVRPHADRVIRITNERLAAYARFLGSSSASPELIFPVSATVEGLALKLGDAARVRGMGLSASNGWVEASAQVDGTIIREWSRAPSDGVVLQGPNFYVGNPFAKDRRRTLGGNQDYDSIDLETLDRWAVPATTYHRALSVDSYRGRADRLPDGSSHLDHYRLAWRKRVANGGERTLVPVIIPPGWSHIHQVLSTTSSTLKGGDLLVLAAVFQSLLSDFSIRLVPKDDALLQTVNRLAIPTAMSSAWRAEVALRVLRQQCLTEHYSALWNELFDDSFRSLDWAFPAPWRSTELGNVSAEWSPTSPVRIAGDRRQIQLELDVLIAIGLGVDVDELCSLYRTQFAVLYGYDRSVYFYDAKGRMVPNSVLTVWRKKADHITGDERTATNQAGNTYTYELPFVSLDREADMRQAYAEFERRLAERS